ncbi:MULTISPECIES: cold shock domain-containing protein [unclassified Solwaraspora]|uniref:cold-shock protein n=1 Tax=unclassified Solwaraspora TaxID=2627926 RepID=UPI00248D3699|nr:MULTISPECIES: cold shock domain-containing protein [unclassified Solwaraspora]WBB98301.1 cold shock domain-containing protein [Solwaraspora sp. WMMA2059]WBC23145.1 cold shock domain-containing protein [Solwaraspora sp. WMMA2080]WJK34788.1 cold shock domain-containing protein [Solwaraspora sp. WMMA2065]
MGVGRVVRFDEGRGYGFIAPDDGGDDVFVHAGELTQRGIRVATGTRVSFKVIDGGRGPKAYDVEIIDDATAPTGGPGGRTAGASGEGGDDELCEIFSEPEYLQRITELLLSDASYLTGAQIVELRGHLLRFSRKCGWVD